MAYKLGKLTHGDSKLLNNYELLMENYSKKRNKLDLYSDIKLLLNYFIRYSGNFIENKFI